MEILVYVWSIDQYFIVAPNSVVSEVTPEAPTPDPTIWGSEALALTTEHTYTCPW